MIIFHACTTKNNGKEKQSQQVHEEVVISQPGEIESKIDHVEVVKKLENPAESQSHQGSFGSEFYLPLDAETPIFNYYSQPVTTNDSLKLIWFNSDKYSLDFFDLATKQLEKKVYFEKSGPNSLPGISFGSGMKYVNPDTIVFYSQPLNRIYLANSAGKVYHKLDFSDLSHGLGSLVTSSIAYRKGSIYMQYLPHIPIDAEVTYSPNYDKIAKIDLSTGAVVEFEIPYPSDYSDKIISQQLKMIDLIYNENRDVFVISFPLSSTVYVTNFMAKGKLFNAKSDLVLKAIETDPMTSVVEPSRISNYYYWINSAYERILYDPIHGVYLREARKGITEEKYKNRKFSSKREFLVLNEDFDQIGTIEYEGSSLYYHFFADGNFYWNKDLQKFNLENGVEDTIFFQNNKLLIDLR